MPFLSSIIAPPSLPVVVAVVIVLLLFYNVIRIIYNVYLHPLRSYPGPKLWAASHIFAAWYAVHGTLIYKLKDLHKTYGDILRIGPDEVVYIGRDAQKDIYAFGSGKGPLPKSRDFYFSMNGVDSIVSTQSNAEHARVRKLLNPGFSERAMREQEGQIMKYINLFIQRLHERRDQGPQDLSKWYNLVTFDVIGDLAFGEPFGSVDSGDYHPWVHTMMKNNMWSVLLGNAMRFPLLQALLYLFIPADFKAERAMMFTYTKNAVARRLQLRTSRSDFMTPLLRESDKGLAFTIPELEVNAMTMVVAGSETTATLLTGLTFYLTTNPHILDKLTAEIRSSFSSDADITLSSVNRLKYELAVLNEGLRMFPPASAGLPRRVPKCGLDIAGKFVPEGTRVHTSSWAAFQSPAHFHLPDSFIPERWLDDPRFANDDRAIMTPFSIGPRNCIGMNLAYAEMRTIVAKLLWNFDLSLTPHSYNWLSTARKYQQWYREPLWVQLKVREGLEKTR